MTEESRRERMEADQEFIAAVISADLQRRRRENLVEAANFFIGRLPKEKQEKINVLCYIFAIALIIFMFAYLYFH